MANQRQLLQLIKLASDRAQPVEHTILMLCWVVEVQAAPAAAMTENQAQQAGIHLALDARPIQI
jgi:hypothetical protein